MAVITSLAVVPLVDSNALKQTKGIGTSNEAATTRPPRRDVTKARRDICSHRSIDTSVITSNVKFAKYIAQGAQYVT